MPNNYFQFKQFIIQQETCGMRVSTDACILGAWFADKTGNAQHILDIGCGTGLISLMLAQKSSGFFTGIEIEKECFEQANQNIQHSPWQNRCNVFLGDIRKYKFERKFDFIISNPPFFENQLTSPHNKIQLAKHSHTLNLKELCDSILENLSAEGQAGILLPYYRTEEAKELFKKQGLYLTGLLKIRQTEKHDFFRSILHFKRINNIPCTNEELIIKINGQYSTEFSQILKDYYLNL